jgi:glycine cleavage system H protein
MTVALVLCTIVAFLATDEILQRVRAKRARVAASMPVFPALKFPADARLALNHIWLKQEGGVTMLGVDEFVGRLVGKVQGVILPAVGSSASPKSSSVGFSDGGRSINISLPVVGRIVEVNPALRDEPAIVHDDPYGAGWLMKVKVESDSGAKTLTPRRVRTWLRTEFDLAKKLILGDMVQMNFATLQDGGVPEDGILKLCDAPIWKHCEERFFAASNVEVAGEKR